MEDGATHHPTTVVSIGTFDGVHLGHRALLERSTDLALGAPPRTAGGGGGRVVVMVFDPHPAACLRPDAVPDRLTTFSQRERIIREVVLRRCERVGVPASPGGPRVDVIRLTPDDGLLSQSAAEFFDGVAARFSPSRIVEGESFRFGRGRAGTPETLRELGLRRSPPVGVEIVPRVECVLTDLTVAACSSTLVRWCLRHGRIGDARVILGRPHELDGEVVRGDRRGRTIGFPTANVRTECMLPGDGVYAGVAELPDGRRYVAAINVGARPTVGDSSRSVEAHLIGAQHPGPDGAIPGLPEYSWRMRLTLDHWLRDVVRFDSIDRLCAQLRRDCARAFTLVSPVLHSAGRSEEGGVRRRDQVGPAGAEEVGTVHGEGGGGVRRTAACRATGNEPSPAQEAAT